MEAIRRADIESKVSDSQSRITERSVILSELVFHELIAVRRLSFEELLQLPPHERHAVDITWKRRVGLTRSILTVGDDMIVVIANAFLSKFPHLYSVDCIDGFRMSREGRRSALTQEDRSTID